MVEVVAVFDESIQLDQFRVSDNRRPTLPGALCAVTEFAQRFGVSKMVRTSRAKEVLQMRTDALGDL